MKKLRVQFGDYEFPIYVIRDAEDADRVLSKLLEKDQCFGLDIETFKKAEFKDHKQAGLCPFLSGIRLVQIYDGNSAYVFDLFKIGSVRKLYRFLSTKNFVAHNALFEIKHLTFNCVEKPDVGCSMLMAQMISTAESSPYDPDPEEEAMLEEEPDGLSRYRKKGHGLKDCAGKYLGFVPEKDLQVSDWGAPELSSEQYIYAGADAFITYELGMLLYQKILDYKMQKHYKLLKAAQYTVAEMELTGFPVDWNAHQKLIDRWDEAHGQAIRDCYPYFRDLNLNSSKQMGEWVAKYFKRQPDVLERWPKTPKGAYSFNATAVANFKELPPIKALLTFKEYDKLLNTYGDSLREKKHPITGRIHPSYTLGETRTGRLSSRNPNCFSGDTEVLTKAGWIRFDDYEGAAVAQFDPMSNSITFVLPTKVHKYPASKLVHIHTRHIDLCVTPDHDCLVQTRRSGVWKKFPAAELPEDHVQYHASFFNGEEEVPPMLLRLIVATQADGSWAAGDIDFGFTKRRKYERLLWLLDSLNASYSDYSNERRFRIKVKKSSVTELIYRYLGDEKIFGWWVLNFSASSLQVFSDELMYWDGLVTRRCNYGSVKKINVDVVQTVFALTNRRARQRIYKYGGGKAHYQVDVAQRRHGSMTTNRTITELPGEHIVYCVSVPSSNLLVRRNGKICITGNCQNFPRDMEFRSIFGLPKEGSTRLVVADFSQIELRIQAELSRDPVMLKVYKEKDDIYKVMASSLLKKPVSKIDKDERQTGKVIVLGLGYGMGGNKLAMQAKAQYGITLDGKRAHGAYHSTFKVYSGYCKQVRDRALQLGYARTVLGKMRRLAPDEVFTRAPNFIVQGSAAELMMASLCFLKRELPSDCRLVGTIHDELIVECPKSRQTQTIRYVEEAMSEAMEYMFPKAVTFDVADAHSGLNWAEAKG